MQVFKGIHIDTGQEVALKHITGQFQLRGRNNMDASQTLTRELTAMQNLSHRHILKLLDAIPQARLLAAAICVLCLRMVKFCGNAHHATPSLLYREMGSCLCWNCAQ